MERQPVNKPISMVKLQNRKLWASIIMVVLIPLVIILGVNYLENNSYYIISFLIIACTVMSFLMIFENKKPKAREVVLIAVMSSIAVAGRAIFFMIPQFKPVIAIVLLTGACFGSQVGFVTGAMTAFTSNLLFGQGPWTPWQMFALGMVGFLSGIIFTKFNMKKSKVSLCITGGISSFFIYGFIINIGSLIIFTGELTMKRTIVMFGAAFWFDVIQSVATVIFLLLISDSFVEKLERIKIKHGLMKI